MTLQKVLKFDDDVLDTLRGMTWNEDGTIGKLPPMKLDRHLYERVDKALVAMGGKWKAKTGHVFAKDPRPLLGDLLGTGALTVVKDGFFRTPREVVKFMVELVYPTGNVLEPEAGDGAIADQLPILQDRIFCIERDPDRAQRLRDKGYTVLCGDFLLYKPRDEWFDTIFMNPPFEEGQDIEHVRHAYELLRAGGSMISVMGEGAFFRTDRRAVAFREWMKVHDFHSEQLPEHSFRESGTDVATRLVWVNRK